MYAIEMGKGAQNGPSPSRSTKSRENTAAALTAHRAAIGDDGRAGRLVADLGEHAALRFIDFLEAGAFKNVSGEVGSFEMCPFEAWLLQDAPRRGEPSNAPGRRWPRRGAQQFPSSALPSESNGSKLRPWISLGVQKWDRKWDLAFVPPISFQF